MPWAHTCAVAHAPGASRVTLRSGETLFANAQQAAVVVNYVVKQGKDFDALEEGKLPRHRSPAFLLDVAGSFDSSVTRETYWAYTLTLNEMKDAGLITTDRYPRVEDCMLPLCSLLSLPRAPEDVG